MSEHFAQADVIRELREELEETQTRFELLSSCQHCDFHEHDAVCTCDKKALAAL